MGTGTVDEQPPVERLVVFLYPSCTGATERRLMSADEEKYKDFVEVTGYGVDPLGLCGINCYHNFWPFIPGASKRLYTDEQLDRMNAKENEKKEYNGKEYTTYEATQRMRQLETIMRKQRQDIHLLKQSGAADEEIKAARAKYRKTSAEYSDFADTMNMKQRRDRVTVDGLGRV